jgi:hypothetical protein
MKSYIAAFKNHYEFDKKNSSQPEEFFCFNNLKVINSEHYYF